MMVSLFIHTCTEDGLIALYDDQSVLFEGSIPQGLQNSRYIMPAIQEGLSKNHLSITDLSAIALTIGPGSYTGIRVGASIAKAFAFATGIKIIAIHTLYGLLPPDDGTFYALLDAKISGVYLSHGKCEGGNVVSLSEPDIVALNELPLKVAPQSILISPDAKRLQKKLATNMPKNQYQWVEVGPSLSAYLAEARRMARNNEAVTYSKLDLLYLRKTQAELEKENKALSIDRDKR